MIAQLTGLFDIVVCGVSLQAAQLRAVYQGELEHNRGRL